MDVWNAWRWVPKGMDSAVRDGMDRAQVESTLTMLGIKRHAWPKIFRSLRVMEAAALEVLNEK